MSRRRQQFMDGSDSSDEEGSDFRASFNISERDLEEEAEGFSGHRKRRKFTKEDAMLGIWAEDDEDSSNAPSPAVSSRPKYSSGINFTPSRVDSPLSRTQSPQSRNESPEPTSRPGLGGGTAAAKSSGFRQTPSTPPVVNKDFAKFASHGTGFGMKMLQKMGWQMGKGLGAEGEGIINPIETKQRPTRMGIAFKGFDERTKQHKEEAARRGEVVSDEEMEEAPVKTKKRRDAWKKDVLTPSVEKEEMPSKSRKSKVVYKTASEIIKESATSQPIAEKIIDMTGPAVREITSLSQVRSQSPTMMETSTRLPELRHNLRLIADLSLSDLDHLTREKRLGEVRAQNLEQEREQLQNRLDSDDAKMKRVDELQRIGREIEAISKSALATGAFEQGDITAMFGEHFKLLETQYSEEYKDFGLDALVVSVWAPIMKYGCVRWDVLSSPTWSSDLVSRWRRLLPSNDDLSRSDDAMDVDGGYHGRQRNGRRSGAGNERTLLMTPFESMMFTIWLPKVRSAINNTWNPREADPIIHLLEAWAPPTLPLFIYESIIDQLILPKLSKAVSDWDPRNDPVQIHTWIHPWLPTLKAWRLSPIFTSIRQKLSVILRQWHPSDESALHILEPWKEVWDANPMEKLIIKSILPKLTQVMRTEFVVNPREQNLEPLTWCLAWKDLISPILIGQLLDNEFFPKWLDVLYKWVTLNPRDINWDEVGQWYSWWKQVFASYGLDENPLVKSSFRNGLELMNRASSGEHVENPAVEAAR
ncbi:GC-rich sequence DNA-binding factor-like protein-domain-containing protein [Umbelopsis sp. PMI_123]|nr:GC-rich sequence DNA-binding factor-like protein-domain-containing protein [Umbelopsis sp. PMI_123]